MLRINSFWKQSLGMSLDSFQLFRIQKLHRPVTANVWLYSEGYDLDPVTMSVETGNR